MRGNLSICRPIRQLTRTSLEMRWVTFSDQKSGRTRGRYTKHSSPATPPVWQHNLCTSTEDCGCAVPAGVAEKKHKGRIKRRTMRLARSPTPNNKRQTKKKRRHRLVSPSPPLLSLAPGLLSVHGLSVGQELPVHQFLASRGHTQRGPIDPREQTERVRRSYTGRGANPDSWCI